MLFFFVLLWLDVEDAPDLIFLPFFFVGVFVWFLLGMTFVLTSSGVLS